MLSVGSRPNFMLIVFKCVSRDPDLLLRAARFTTGYDRFVGQEPAPSKCVLLSTSKAVRAEMRGWVLSDEGQKWTVKLDVRDLGGHLDTTLRGGLPLCPFGYVLSFLVLILFLPFLLTFMVVFGSFVPCFCLVLCMVLRLLICQRVFLLKLRAAIMRAVWSRKQPLASSGAVLSLLDGPHGCDPSFCIVWFGSGFFVGTCPFGWTRFLGSTDFLILFVMAALVMVLFVLWLRVLGVLVFLGTLL